jgi:GntR family transcriptional regulator
MPANRDAKSAIVDDLRAKIDSGEYAPGGRIPGENQIAQQYGVAPLTARAALDVLKQEGLIVARRGSGTRVRDSQPIRRRTTGRLSNGVWQAGRSVWSADIADHRNLLVDQITIEVQPAADHVARVLDIPTGIAVCVRSRRYVLDGRPIQLATSYLPADLVTGTAIVQPDSGPGGIYARLAELDHAPTRFVEELRSRMPTHVEVEQLNLSAGTPVIQIARTAYTADGTVVELNEMVLDANAYVLEYAFDA